MKFICAALAFIAVGGFWYVTALEQPAKAEVPALIPAVPPGDQVITLGAGCFWRMGEVFKQVPGVVSVTAGYAGGTTTNPTHEQVMGGQTGHTEVSRVVFDPVKTSVEKILQAFWAAHDPTASYSAQGRSVIFYQTEEQRLTVEKSLAAEAETFAHPVLTRIFPAGEFYAAEEYHQDFYGKMQRQTQCSAGFCPSPTVAKTGN